MLQGPQVSSPEKVIQWKLDDALYDPRRNFQEAHRRLNILIAQIVAEHELTGDEEVSIRGIANHDWTFDKVTEDRTGKIYNRDVLDLPKADVFEA